MSSNSGGGGGGLADDAQSSRTSGAHRDRNEPGNQRYSSLIYDSELFLTKLREFKPQSLGCLEARRKSSSTLIFPNPQQACVGPPKCPRYPHNVKPTPGYWIECHGPGRAVASSGDASGQMRSGEEQQQQKANSERDFGTSPAKLEELNISITDCGRNSNLSKLSSDSHFSATPTADRILTCRHDGHLDGSECCSNEAVSPPGNLLEQQQGCLLKRGQSFDRLHSNDFEEVAAGAGSDGSTGRSEGRKRAAVAASPRASLDREDNTSKVHSATKGAGDSRKRFSNKRTITRDDIDLHKPRRGTPNITITEPSFNQSTTTYHQPVGSYKGSRNRRAPLRQESAGGEQAGQPTGSELRRTDSTDSQQSNQSSKNEPIKFQIQTFVSLEAQTSIENESGGAFGRQESSDGEGELSAILSYQQTGGESFSGLDFKPYRQQHRPSVIREDESDMETPAIKHVGKPTSNAVGSFTGEHQDIDGSEFYCGLSTTNFQKRPFQQSYHLHQQACSGAIAAGDQFKDGSLELISFEEENYEKHYYGREHWNYFTKDDLLGPVMLSLKQEVNNQRDHFHVLLRTVSYTLHGTIPASTICADRYDREAIVRELSEIAKLDPPLMLGQLPSTPDELLKLDHIFIKTELKVGVIYIKAGQAESEEAILGNKEESDLFSEFLDLLGDRITLKGFDRYKGGLDTVHNLTGTESVYTMWRNIEIMFHVSTMLPHEENDPQKLQKKRHIGNDIVCVAFIESDDTLFWPGCIKSYFLHTFITVRTSPKPVKEGERRKYSVSCVCRNEVQYAFKPYLMEQDEFYKSDYFREWLLVKIVNGERASYSAPKFARMQDRTRSQLLEDIITNLANHLVTGQIPKPYRRGSWRPLGHIRASSPLEDSMKDYFEDYEQLAKDFQNAFCGPNRSMLCDVVFRVKDKDGSYKLVHGVRAIMAIRSRTFLEMLYGFVPPGAAGHSSLQNQTSLRAIELKALSGSESISGASGAPVGASLGKEIEQTKSLLAKRGSVGADSSRKIGEKERRQSMLPALSKSISQKPNYLTVPNTGSGAGPSGGGGGGSGTSGMIKNAFNRLVSGNWSGWSGNIKGYKGEPIHIKVDQNKTKVDLNSLAICKEIAKIDPEKLSQREFEVKEFDYETFQQTIEYIHNGQCKLSYETIPGLICAAEHYDLPDLLHACFHHANTYMKLSAAPKMMNALYQNSCFYVTAMQLLDSIYEYIDPHGNEFFSRQDYLELNESVFTTLLSRKSLQVSELRKFQAMDGWTRQQIIEKQLAKQQMERSQVQKQKSLEEQQQEKLLVDIDREQESTDSQAQQTTTEPHPNQSVEEFELEYRNLMSRLNKGVNVKLDKISNEDLVKIVLPTKVFSNDKIFEVMADESRNEY